MMRKDFSSAGGLALAATWLLAACVAGGDGSRSQAANGEAVRIGYTCCNLHYSGDWISDSNLAQLPFVPAGTPITVKSISGYRAYADVGGQPMRLGLDYGRAYETTEQWIRKIVVLDDPKNRIANFSPAVRGAIEAGQLMPGMTKEQVFIAVGYPQSDETPRLDAQYWRYWRSTFGPYTVYWANNKIKKIEGDTETVTRMTYTGD